MRGITLTKKDMYEKNGKCILPYGGIKKSWRNRSKYNPVEEDKKHRSKK
jgi:hypothetical protein